MNEKKKDDGEEISIYVISFAVIITICIIVLGASMYISMVQPYHITDMLKDHIEDLDVSDDYRQGWMDCADFYLHEMTKATNCTSQTKS